MIAGRLPGSRVVWDEICATGTVVDYRVSYNYNSHSNPSIFCEVEWDEALPPWAVGAQGCRKNWVNTERLRVVSALEELARAAVSDE